MQCKMTERVCNIFDLLETFTSRVVGFLTSDILVGVGDLFDCLPDSVGPLFLHCIPDNVL